MKTNIIKTKTLYPFLLMLIAFSITAYSQEEKSYGFEKGDFFIAGAVNYGGEGSFNRTFIQPALGYFLTSNISIGAQSNFLVSEDNEYYSTNTYGAGINGRYYFMPKKRFNVFAELAIDYSRHEGTYTNSNGSFLSYNRSTEQSDAINTSISTGLNFFITKNLSIFTKIDLWKLTRSEEKYNLTDGTSGYRPNTETTYRGPYLSDISLGLQFKF